MTMMILGGITGPSPPATAMRPADCASGYFISIGDIGAGENGRLGQAAADAAGENVGKVHDLAGDAAGRHQVAGENEQRDGHERERVHARIQALRDRDDGDITVKKADQRGEPE